MKYFRNAFTRNILQILYKYWTVLNAGATSTLIICDSRGLSAVDALHDDHDVACDDDHDECDDVCKDGDCDNDCDDECDNYHDDDGDNDHGDDDKEEQW